MASLTFTMPFPPAELNPNRKSGRHWATTSMAKADYRLDCFYLAAAASRGFVPPKGDVALTLTFVQPDKRRRDLDNLLSACKAGLDGVAAALKVDDSRFKPVTIKREFGAKPGVVIVEVA